MNTEKLIQLIEVQNQLINILCKEYKVIFRSPVEKQNVSDLQELLKNLQKELKL